MGYIGIISAVLVVWNVIVFALYGIDKRKAVRKSHRISERTLLVTCALFGSVGAFLGMTLLRHKTKHLQFKIGVPLLLIVNLAIIGFALRWYLTL